MGNLLCLTALAALALVGCSRDLPRVEVARELDQLYPHAPGVHLTLEVQAEQQGELLLAWKSKRRLQEATYRSVGDIEAEYRRAGVLSDRPGRADEVAFDPRRETRISLLEPVDPVGTEFEIEGFIAARKVLGRWEVAGLEVRRERPGQTLAQYQRDAQGDATRRALFGTRDEPVILLGSKEWGEHVAAMQKLLDQRAEKIRRADEQLFTALRPGQYFEFDYDRIMSGSVLVQVWTFPGDRPGEGIIHFHTPSAPEWTRTFRFGPQPLRRTGDYVKYPQTLPYVEAQAVALGPNNGFDMRFFVDPKAVITLQVEDGRLKMETNGWVFDLRPRPAPSAKASAGR